MTNGTDSSTIALYRDGIVISSKVITFSGMVTFTDLSTPGRTTINGGNLMTGTVTADYVKANISISAPTITGGTITGVNINGAAFHNANGNAWLELGDDIYGYGDMILYAYDKSTGSRREVFRVYDGVGSGSLRIYENTVMRGTADGVTAVGKWSFGSSNTKLIVPCGYSLPSSGESGQVFFLLE